MNDVRLIDANAVSKTLRNLSFGYAKSFAGQAAIKEIEDAPTIDAVPVVHARWVHEQRYGDSGGWVWRCSACRREAISPIISALKYCHSCGAKMDGGTDT